MTDVEAAYQLGYQTQMLRRAMLYHWRFASFDAYHSSTQDDTVADQKWCIAQLDAAINFLTPIVGKTLAKRVGRRFDSVVDVCLELIAAYQAKTRWEETDPCPGDVEWLILDRTSNEMLESNPRLRRWYTLGRAIGRCCLRLLSDSSSPTRFDVTSIVQSAGAMSDSARQRMPLLAKLALVPAGEARLGALKALDEILNIPEERRPNYTEMYEGHFITLLRVICLRIPAEMQLLPRLELLLDKSDLGQFQAILNGNALVVTADQLFILMSLVKAGGELVKGEDIQKEHGSMLAKSRIDRAVKKLPEALLSMVVRKKGQGGGYRLCLD